MKICISFLSFLMFVSATAQDITGQWLGVLKVQNTQLRIVFHIEKDGDGYRSTMDSPDQGAKGIPVSATTFVGSKIILAIPAATIEYQGKLEEDSITGTFRQSGMEFPLNLGRLKAEQGAELISPAKASRPQEPEPPYPYLSEDLEFENNEAGISLAGTLTVPKSPGPFPAVVLITGSGPQNRNEELLGHKPFLVLADHLTRNGIAVLRFDDRGIGESGGDFSTATSLDFVTDVASAVAYLKSRKEIDPLKIGLIGHSEGGMVAPMVASRSKDVSFMVLLAGTGLPGYKIVSMQNLLISRAAGADEQELLEANAFNDRLLALVVNNKDQSKLSVELTTMMADRLNADTTIQLPPGISKEQYAAMQANQLVSPWMQFFLKHDPAPVLEKITIPVLALNGEKDLQVPPKENLGAIEVALKKAGNSGSTVKELPGLNHLFQEAETGSPSEYGTIEQTMSPLALNTISDWIRMKMKMK